MSPHAKTGDHVEAQDEVKLLEKKSSDSSMCSYSESGRGLGRRATEISIFICEDGHKFNCDDIPKSNFDTTYLKSITSFQNPPRSKMATCCFALAILVIVSLTAIAIIAGVCLRSTENSETVAVEINNSTVTNHNVIDILKKSTNFSSSESPNVTTGDDLITSPSSI